MTNTRRVALFGSFDPTFLRTRQLTELLALSGCTVCDIGNRGLAQDRVALANKSPVSHLVLAIRLAWLNTSSSLHLLKTNDLEAILVPYPGWMDLPWAAAVARRHRIPLVFDQFISLHDTVVDDRNIVRAESLSAKLLRALEAKMLRHADLILVDTEEQADHYARKFNVERDRFVEIPLSTVDPMVVRPSAPYSISDDTVDNCDSPRNVNDTNQLDNLNVLYFGTYIPLHGVDVILKAAALCSNLSIQFQLIGNGQERPRMLSLADDLNLGNVEFYDFSGVEDLAQRIGKANVCLGVFSTSGKALRVVPTKVYESLAAGKAIVSADCASARRLLSGAGITFVTPGDPHALAAALAELSTNRSRIAQMQTQSRDTFDARFSMTALAERMRTIVDALGRQTIAGGIACTRERDEGCRQ